MGNQNKFIQMAGKSGRNTPARAAPRAARRHRRTETFSVYIYRVLKQVHPETGVSKRSMSIMNSFINDIFEKIASEASRLVIQQKTHSLIQRSPNCCQTPPPRRARQARRLRGNQGCYQILILSTKIFNVKIYV